MRAGCYFDVPVFLQDPWYLQATVFTHTFSTLETFLHFGSRLFYPLCEITHTYWKMTDHGAMVNFSTQSPLQCIQLFHQQCSAWIPLTLKLIVISPILLHIVSSCLYGICQEVANKEDMDDDDQPVQSQSSRSAIATTTLVCRGIVLIKQSTQQIDIIHYIDGFALCINKRLYHFHNHTTFAFVLGRKGECFFCLVWRFIFGILYIALFNGTLFIGFVKIIVTSPKRCQFLNKKMFIYMK